MGFLLDESPAIKALGPLFKLTEVHFWDDGSSEARDASDYLEPVQKFNDDYSSKKSEAARIDGFSMTTEDLELAQQLSGLGLPLSFHTNKEKRNGVVSGRRKATTKNNKLLPKVIDDDLLHSVKESEYGSPSDALDISETLDLSEIQNHRTLADVDILLNLSAERDDSISSFVCSCDITNDCVSFDEVSNLGFENNLGSFGLSNIPSGESVATMSKKEKVAASLVLKDGSSAINCLSNDAIFVNELRRETSSVNRGISSVVHHETKGQSNGFSIEMLEDVDVAAGSKLLATTFTDNIANHKKTDSEEWITYWDDFYLRNYFYNVITKETTWDPPVEMEHIPFVTAGESTYRLVEMAEIDEGQLESRNFDELSATCCLQPDLYFAKELRDDDKLSSQQFDESAACWILSDCISSIKNTKKKKRVRRTKSDWRLSNLNEDLQGVLLEAAPRISKYWWQRYILFSKFDDGIKMDEEGWFSVTPEPLAKHHAIRCGSGSIIDFFTGVGGNAIQFAQRSKHVIAIDIDPNKIDYAKHNASLYGVEDKIDFVRGDSFSLARKLKADTVFMSPPWGGPDYTRVKKFDINTMLKPKDGKFLFTVGQRIAPKIVMFLPRNVDINQLAELSLAATPPWSLEVEKNFLNDRLKAVTAYFCEPPSFGTS